MPDNPEDLTLEERAQLQVIANRHRDDPPIGSNSEGIGCINYTPSELLFLHGLAERLGKLDVLIEQLKLYEEVLLTGKFSDDGRVAGYQMLAEDSLERCRRMVDVRYPIPERRRKAAVR